jgi:DNA-directed RNA polymerase subunit K/omega
MWIKLWYIAYKFFKNKEYDLILPLDLLIRNTGNMYLLACAAIKRVAQLSNTGEKELEEYQKKFVSVALKQILNEEIQYKLEE